MGRKIGSNWQKGGAGKGHFESWGWAEQANFKDRKGVHRGGVLEGEKGGGEKMGHGGEPFEIWGWPIPTFSGSPHV